MTDDETIKRLQRELEESETTGGRWGEAASRQLIDYNKELQSELNSQRAQQIEARLRLGPPSVRFYSDSDRPPKKRGLVETVLKIGAGLCLFALIVWAVLSAIALSGLAKWRW